MLLHAPADAAPNAFDPFVVVDEGLVVHAISHQAELLLMVEEPAGIGTPLGELLVSNSGDSNGAQLTRIVARAVSGAPSIEPLELVTVGQPQIHFSARATTCGPPSAALLVLAPLGTRMTSSRNGRRSHLGRGSPTIHTSHE
jgi:hypothetical protein